MYIPGKSAFSNSGHRRENPAYYASTLTIGDSSYYRPFRSLEATKVLPAPSSRHESHLHLPGPEAGTSHRDRDERETNSSWPFPADYRSQPANAERESTSQIELDVNASWPHPTPAQRKRTSSQLSSLSLFPSSSPVERLEQKQNANWPQPASASKKPMQATVPQSIPRQPSLPCTDSITVSPLLAKGSPNLVHLDLRLPYTCARKLVRSAHWTHLNHGDLKQPASHPPREHMRLYIPECADWIIEVRARPIYGWDYVTVEDILEALHKGLDRPVEHDRWARDSVNPRHAERVKKACSWRVAMLNDKKLVSYEDARQRGLLRVDYLGSRCLFSGFTTALGGDGSEWWALSVSSEPRT